MYPPFSVILGSGRVQAPGFNMREYLRETSVQSRQSFWVGSQTLTIFLFCATASASTWAAAIDYEYCSRGYVRLTFDPRYAPFYVLSASMPVLGLGLVSAVPNLRHVRVRAMTSLVPVFGYMYNLHWNPGPALYVPAFSLKLTWRRTPAGRAGTSARTRSDWAVREIFLVSV